MAMLNITDFTSALQLAATLNMAFILAEYANSYSLLVLKKFFKFNEMLERLDKACRSHIDTNTVDSFVAHTVDGYSTQDKIEEIKRKVSKKSELLDKSKKDFQDRFEKDCNTKSFSYISLYMALYCISSLLLAKFTELYVWAFLSWGVFTIISLFWMIATFWWGEHEHNWLKVNYCSLKSCTKSYLGIIVTSIVLACIVQHYVPTFNLHQIPVGEWLVVLPTIVLPYLGFIVFVYKVWNAGKHIVEDIKKHYDNEISACKDIANEIDSYSKLESLSVKVCTSTNGKQENRTNISVVNANNGEVKTEHHPNYLKKPQQKNRWKNGKR